VARRTARSHGEDGQGERRGVAEGHCARLQNRQPGHPLAAFIFSRDKAAIDRFIGELSFGGGAVNQVNIHLFIETMPFGAVGPSGMGHYYGKYRFDMLTHAKSMLISTPDVAIKHLFPPFSPEKNADLKIWSGY
jgi:aldehyde dehydrogenase (NAD+)